MQPGILRNMKRKIQKNFGLKRSNYEIMDLKALLEFTKFGKMTLRVLQKVSCTGREKYEFKIYGDINKSYFNTL